MQNHALSLAQQVRASKQSQVPAKSLGFCALSLNLSFGAFQAGLQVHVIAYGGSKVRAAIAAHQNIRVHIIPELCALYQAHCESSEVANEESKGRQ